RAGDGSFQDADRGHERNSDPREHFRGYHEMRRDRAVHYQCSEKTEAVRAPGRSPRRNKWRAREAVVKRKWPGADCRGRSRRRRAESRCCREAQMKLGPTSVLLAIAATLCAEELPRKAKTTRENYPNVDVIYDSVTTPDGKRLRTIITKPRDAKGKVPVIFVAGWLSCDSVEAPAGAKDESGLVFRGLAQLPEFALFRMDKQGVGDSEGVCAETDFESELAGYRAAFRALKNYDFLDTKRIYLLGISNGGGFAPLVAESDSEQAQVRGYISVGGWVKTWLEHMLEIERRRFALMGKSPGEINDRMKGVATLYYEWLIKGRSVDDILKEQPKLADLWPGGKDHAHLYGRPLGFYQQLQQLNLAAAWSRVKVPTYVLRGAFDWIM